MFYNLFFLLVVLSHNNQTTQTSDSIISDIYEKYASCKSYQDSGNIEIIDTIYDDGYVFRKSGKFQTIFIRDKGFKFYYEVQDVDVPAIHYKLMIHEDFDSSYAMFYIKRGKRDAIIEKMSLGKATAKATGTTSSVINIVPKLLMENRVLGKHLLTSNSFEQIEDSIIDDLEYNTFKSIYKFDRNSTPSLPENEKDSIKEELDNKYKNSGIVRMEKISWFDKKSHQLKKIQHTMKEQNASTKINIIYQSSFDEVIDEKKLKFHIPK